MQWLHWRQLVVLFEILLLFVVGFLPQELNLLANSIVSFSCAMQVQAFRKVNGYAFASTMCIGNLRSGMDSLCAWLVGGNAKAFGKAVHYFAIIFLFALGAGSASCSSRRTSRSWSSWNRWKPTKNNCAEAPRMLYYKVFV